MTPSAENLPCHVVLPAKWEDFFQRRGPVPPRLQEARRFVRQHCPMRAILDVSASLPAFPREPARHVVLMKDISRQGASFLHAEQLFPGERIELTLPTGRIRYTVARCRRHNDRCYEIGAAIG